MVVCVATKSRGQHEIVVTIYEAGFGPPLRMADFKVMLSIREREVPNEKWLRQLGRLIAELDPDWESKKVVFKINLLSPITA